MAADVATAAGVEEEEEEDQAAEAGAWACRRKGWVSGVVVVVVVGVRRLRVLLRGEAQLATHEDWEEEEEEGGETWCICPSRGKP